MRLGDRIADAAVAVAMETLGRAAYARLIAQARRPEETQHAALLAIMRACADTGQGRRFGLSDIRSVDDFRRRAPIQTYEDLRPAIDRQIATGDLEIAPTKPLMYARSSGTTGAPKHIPVTGAVARQLRRAQRVMAFVLHRQLDAFTGDVIGVSGAMREVTLAGGAAAGASTGLIYATMPRFLRTRYALPHEVFALSDYDVKYRVIARLAAAAGDASVIATANPATILRLMDVLRGDLPRILSEIDAGAFAGLAELPPDIARAVARKLRPDPARAAALKPLLAKGPEVTLGDIWPGMRAVVTWLGGGCALAAEAVRRQLPDGATMADPGYLASEMRATVVVDVARNLALPMLEDVFLEFAPVQAWDAGKRETLLVHELEPGEDYHVMVTTSAGLLRYHMNDVVRAGPKIGATPSLTFVRKGRGVTSLAGEKLSEDQVHAAMASLSTELGGPPAFFIVVADAAAGGYRAYVEAPRLDGKAAALETALDEALAELNIEYASKRASRRLPPIAIVALQAGAGSAYHRHCVERKGQREAQAKVMALQTAEELDFDFSPFEVDRASDTSQRR